MNKKKIVYLIVGIIFLVSLTSIIIFLNKNKNNNKNEYTLQEQNEISELEESNKKMPAFNIAVSGDYEGEINLDFLEQNEKKAYNFNIKMPKGNKVETIEFVGYKLEDVLQASDLFEYSSLEFKNDTDNSLVIKDVNDNKFLVFMENGKKIKPMILQGDKSYNKSLANVTKLIITNNYVILDDENQENNQKNEGENQNNIEGNQQENNDEKETQQ